MKENDQLIGFCNTGIKEELSLPNREVAFAISKHYRNKGYTTQAVKGLMKYLFEKTNVEQLNAVVLPQNIASNKVIVKCGFHHSRDVEIDNQEFYHYKIFKEEFE
ncbi:GNAT family N-acetyltransferase [Bacillus alkalicellulosilyticus]|uniref:GNAT family N-acetyltransferase n=1 Tax=Alkalihalobacterium alkalicellulosilyticum TaxID=1912214 RepID=UPI001FE73F64|nr:GNAT family protein [Bacillus alkalicellulosilyticus]